MATSTKSTSSTAAAAKAVGDTKPKTARKVSLKDTDEIILTASVPNLTYRDKKTGDYYTWSKTGDTEYITFAALKDMYRNHGRYLSDLLLLIDDERAIKHFRLERVYDRYNELFNIAAYTKENIKDIGSKINTLPPSVTRTLVTKIKSSVTAGEISDVTVIKKLEQALHIELFELL